jgi:RNA polymerase sigma factor (sigma-70 family)
MGGLANVTDAELLAAYQASRSADAFAALVARHAPWLLRLCQRRSGRHQDGEDATQAVFLALARHPERVHHSLPGWLYRTAQRAVKDLQRAALRRARRASREASATMACPPPHAAESTECQEEIREALGRLPTRLRQAVVLRYLEGFNQREAAQRLGCPQGTLATRTRVGLLRLRALISRP